MTSLTDPRAQSIQAKKSIEHQMPAIDVYVNFTR